MTTIQFILLILVAAIAGMGSVLDEAQFHRPLVACTLVGLVLGDITTGIILGGTLEMLALGWMNVGAAMAPDAALASVISSILVIVGHQSIGAGIALLHPRFHDPYLFEESFVAYGRSLRPVFFGAPEGAGTRHFFLICSTDHEAHLPILARLAMLAHGSDLTEKLDAAEEAGQVASIIAECENEYTL